MPISDEINLVTPLPVSGTAQKHVLIFFIPGNPGLVEYYRPFLINLKKNLDKQISQPGSQLKDTQYFIHGASLAGFDVSPGSRRTPSSAQDLPLSLDAQVDDVYTRLETTAKRLSIEHEINGELPVVVIGHSIGAYMAMQTVARWQKSAKAGPTHMRASTGICLFPTIYELNLSPTGRKVGPLTKIPTFALLVHILAKVLFFLVPLAALTSLIRLVMNMPDSGARVTASFLKSPHGVRQALHMAKDELAQLTHDKWPDEFWDASSAASVGVSDGCASVDSWRNKLFFYWGADDHWIARETRDRVIATRARVEGKVGDEGRPVMEIDGNGIGHAFCLSEGGNRVVAEKCVEWIGWL